MPRGFSGQCTNKDREALLQELTQVQLLSWKPQCHLPLRNLHVFLSKVFRTAKFQNVTVTNSWHFSVDFHKQVLTF